MVNDSCNFGLKNIAQNNSVLIYNYFLLHYKFLCTADLNEKVLNKS